MREGGDENPQGVREGPPSPTGDEASKQSEKEQDALGEWLLTEIRLERQWDRAFARSQDLLARLAKEALAEHRRGQTDELDPDTL